MTAARRIEVPVEQGRLAVAMWGEGTPVLAVHGITANHLMWEPVARAVGDGIGLIAPDLRGRGGSARLPGPFGMAAHVRDCIAVLDHLGIGEAMVVGGSMGGYVAVLMAARHGDRVSSVGLCDGGVALPVPPGTDPDEMLATTLGPTMQRLDMTFADADDYVDFFKRHPALADWNEAIEAYVRYDIEPADAGRVRTKVNKDAIVADGRDLLVNTEVHDCIGDITCPVWLLRAPRGLLDQPQPLITDEILAQWRKDRLPQLSQEMLTDLNHFTLFLSERGASVIADRIRDSVPALA